MPSRTFDLFDAESPPDDRLFEAWWRHAQRAGQLRQQNSAVTYADLWGVLAKWCRAQDPVVRIDQIGRADLQAFIDSRSGAGAADSELSPRYVWRLLHLVDRVLAHHARESGGARNEAARALLESRPDWRFANAARVDPLPEYLAAGQAKQLVSFLSQARPRSGGRTAVHSWQELRNRASVGLQLGAGLTPGDVRVLTLDSAVQAGGRLKDVPWKVIVPASGDSPVRETPIAEWAGRLLRYWLDMRADAGIQGEQLFPSTKSGKPWGKVAQYLASKQVLEEAGFDDDIVSGGSFRLRHTFALRQLRRGRSPEDVARWLGVDPAVMARYQRVLSAPVDDLV